MSSETDLALGAGAARRSGAVGRTFEYSLGDATLLLDLALQSAQLISNALLSSSQRWCFEICSVDPQSWAPSPCNPSSERAAGLSQVQSSCNWRAAQ